MTELLDALTAERERLTAIATPILERINELQEMEATVAGWPDLLSPPAAAPHVQPPARRELPSPSPSPVRTPARRTTRDEMVHRAAAVLQAIADRDPEPVPLNDLRGLPYTASQLASTVAELLATGKIDRTGHGRWMTYRVRTLADAEVADRNGGTKRTASTVWRVLRAIKDDPGALSEQQIAQALDLDREDVAEACGKLLEDGSVFLFGDGTYQVRTVE